MPYASVDELPAAVRAKVKSAKRRRQWMHVWNGEYAKHGDEQRAFANAWSVVQKRAHVSQSVANYRDRPNGNAQCSKCSMFIQPSVCTLVLGDISPGGWCKFFDKKEESMTKAAQAPSDTFNFFLPLTKVQANKDGSCTVSGYASTPALDLDGEVVSLDAVRKALPGYWEWRNIREMHSPKAVGVAKEANIDEKGLFLTSRIIDPTAVQKCIEGVLKGYSIGGRKLAKSGNVITEIEWIETSIVDRPANPECKFDVAKRAKPRVGDAAVLVKARVPRDPRDKALTKMAGVVELLAKAGPPAAHDGFSLPASATSNRSPKDPEISVDKSAPCEVHGVEGCEECAGLDKRDVSTKERKSLASQGKALPGGGFPIANKDDLANARQAVGRAKNPEKARALIRRRAKELGVDLPPKWKKAAGRAFIAAAEKKRATAAVAQAGSLPFLDLVVRSEVLETSSQVSGQAMLLSKGGEHRGEPFLKLRKSIASQKLSNADEALALTGLGTQSLAKLGASVMDTMALETLDLESISDPLEKALATLIKRGATPTRMQRMQMARANMKKARDVRKECAASIEKVHKMLKGAYLAKVAALEKAGGSAKPKADDDGDFDFAKAMTELQKAYSAMSMQKTFMKAADAELKKAASRGGQTAQEPSTSDEPFYTAPGGIKNLSPQDLATAAPGGSARCSEPPLYPSDGSVYPGKNAKLAFKKGQMIPSEYLELVERAARAEATAETLAKMPAMTAGRRPMVFDPGKNGGFTAGDGRTIDAQALYKGVDPADLRSPDEHTHNAASAKVIGNYLKNAQFGKSVFDDGFHGTAGMAARA